MKKSDILLIILFLYSCGVKKTSDEDNRYIIFKKERLSEIFLIHAYNKKDTVLFIANDILINNCKSKVSYLNKDKCKQIEYYVNQTQKDTIYFVFNMEDVNNRLKINSGFNKPGNIGTIIKSYNCYPYLIENCNSIK